MGGAALHTFIEVALYQYENMVGHDRYWIDLQRWGVTGDTFPGVQPEYFLVQRARDREDLRAIDYLAASDTARHNVGTGGWTGLGGRTHGVIVESKERDLGVTDDGCLAPICLKFLTGADVRPGGEGLDSGFEHGRHEGPS
jgi:hypothetical protein